MSETAPLPKVFGNTIFCDDIRQEVGGKVTYVGVYTGGMNIHVPFPATLPKFCAWITYFEKPDEVADNISFLIMLPGETEENPAARIDMDLKEQREKLPKGEKMPDGIEQIRRLDIPVQFSPITFNEPGFIRVRALIGDEVFKIGSLKINDKPPETPVAEAS